MLGRAVVAAWESALRQQDAERKESFAEAEATHPGMMDVYVELSYDLIPLPLASIEARAQFVSRFARCGTL